MRDGQFRVIFSILLVSGGNGGETLIVVVVEEIKLREIGRESPHRTVVGGGEECVVVGDQTAY